MAQNVIETLFAATEGAGDLSREVLATIFGDNWWALTENSANQGIYALLGTLNVICAAIIAWLMFLTLIVATTGAASEGTALGGKYRNPWLPLRLAFAMAAVTPVHNVCVCDGKSPGLCTIRKSPRLSWKRSLSAPCDAAQRR